MLSRLPAALALLALSLHGETRTLDLSAYRDKVQGAWLGQIVGAMFGWPFEGKPKSVARVERYSQGFSYAPVDDDYYYEMVALWAFEKHGLGLTVEQLGEEWKARQAGSWGSSEQARLALDKGIRAPETGSPRYNRWFYTIGPQFSADLYGMLAPGMVNAAGNMARTYSHINGYAEGVDGAVFIAACVSEAFFETKTEKIVRQAAQLIPPGSNYRRALDQVLDGYAAGKKWDALARETETRWRVEYPQMNNAVANGALVAIALLYGGGDFLDSLNLAVQSGDNTDADCNAANVGAVLGAMHGVRAIPRQFVEPLRDRIYGESMGPVKFRAPVDEKISDLASRIAALGEKNLLANGAVRRGAALSVRREKPETHALETFDVNEYAQLWNRLWRMEGAGRGPGGPTTFLDGSVLVTWPRDYARPVRLEADMQIPERRPVLALSVSADPGKPWRLDVFAANDRLAQKTVDGPAEVEVDMAKFAGQRVLVRAYQTTLEQRTAPAYWRSIAWR